jgi:DegV family protein with EDD domain
MVKILTDTLSSLPPEIARKYGIPVIPQIINIGEETFKECIDIDNTEFIRRLVSSPTLPKTAAPPPEWFVEEFERMVPAGEPILCIHPSAEVSGTVRSALIAAKEFPQADIRVIDTRIIARPLGTLVEMAVQWAVEGQDANTIQAGVLRMASRCRIYVVVDTLEYLAKGGRIGTATALLGTVLQVKPILAFSDGRINQYERERTQKRAVARMRELVVTQISLSGDGYPCVLHSGVLDRAKEFADDLAEELGLPAITIDDVPPAITTHGGPGLLGVGFFVPEETISPDK